MENRIGVETHFGPSQVMVGVTGDVDSLTAPVLAGVLGALIDRGDADLVVDLAQVEFMGAAGFGVLTAMSARLGTVGGTLSIRSPQAQVRRVLEIVAMGALVESPSPTSKVMALAAEHGDQELAAMFVSETSPIRAKSHVEVLAEPHNGSEQARLDIGLSQDEM